MDMFMACNSTRGGFQCIKLVHEAVGSDVEYFRYQLFLGRFPPRIVIRSLLRLLYWRPGVTDDNIQIFQLGNTPCRTTLDHYILRLNSLQTASKQFLQDSSWLKFTLHIPIFSQHLSQPTIPRTMKLERPVRSAILKHGAGRLPYLGS